MRVNDRLETIVSLVNERGFLSVKELSGLCRVSEVTIRRDLGLLQEAGRLVRTHGGAAVLPRYPAEKSARAARTESKLIPDGALAERSDVLIATPVATNFWRALLDRASERGVPIIAESTGFDGAATLVAVDNFAAGEELGRWAGRYALAHFAGKARLLNLTYPLANTRTRTEGFVAGLLEVAPKSEVLLSINGHSARRSAYRLASDVLAVHPDINMIFAINDSTALGARDACLDRGISPDNVILLTFGLEGRSMRNALMEGGHCRAGLAMFPEIVGPVCIQAAIEAVQGRPLPEHLVTPHAVLTRETLSHFYGEQNDLCQLNWDAVRSELHIPLDLAGAPPHGDRLPGRIGFAVPFSEHEWYTNLTRCMQGYATNLRIDLEVIDAVKDMAEDVALREREIARVAAGLVRSGDVILINGGSVAGYLAEELAGDPDINATVITSSLPVLLTLRDHPKIILVSTGGQLQAAGETFSGPTAELALRELRADKLFLAATGITTRFGLSHDDLAEVALKQAMIRAAREVIVLADHTKFGHEAVVQVAPLDQITRLITDNALPASIRLELSKLGIEMLIAKT